MKSKHHNTRGMRIFEIFKYWIDYSCIWFGEQIKSWIFKIILNKSNLLSNFRIVFQLLTRSSNRARHRFYDACFKNGTLRRPAACCCNQSVQEEGFSAATRSVRVVAVNAHLYGLQDCLTQQCSRRFSKPYRYAQFQRPWLELSSLSTRIWL